MSWQKYTKKTFIYCYPNPADLWSLQNLKFTPHFIFLLSYYFHYVTYTFELAPGKFLFYLLNISDSFYQ